MLRVPPSPTFFFQFRESAGFLSRIGAIKKSLEEAKQISNNITASVAPTSENLDGPLLPQADVPSPKFESGKFQHVYTT